MATNADVLKSVEELKSSVDKIFTCLQGDLENDGLVSKVRNLEEKHDSEVGSVRRTKVLITRVSLVLLERVFEYASKMFGG